MPASATLQAASSPNASPADPSEVPRGLTPPTQGKPGQPRRSTPTGRCQTPSAGINPLGLLTPPTQGRPGDSRRLGPRRRCQTPTTSRALVSRRRGRGAAVIRQPANTNGPTHPNLLVHDVLGNVAEARNL